MSLTKQLIEGMAECKVTFTFPKKAVGNAESVHLVGEWDNWTLYASPMERTPGGDFVKSILLKKGREYQFRYLIDETRWENDWNADKYVKTPFGDTENSTVVV